MACPVCSHTMQNLGVDETLQAFQVFWCNRCGTIKSVRPGRPEPWEDVSVPFWTARAGTVRLVNDGTRKEPHVRELPPIKE